MVSPLDIAFSPVLDPKLNYKLKLSTDKRMNILKIPLILLIFTTPPLFGMEGAMAMLSDPTANQNSGDDNNLIYDKVCNTFISIIEKYFDLQSQHRMIINFGKQFDIWHVVPEGFDKIKFTIDNIINSVENELGTKIRTSFQIKFPQGEDFWLPINVESLKDTLSESEYKSVNHELAMVRYGFTPGKVNREEGLKELIRISITFSSGHIRR